METSRWTLDELGARVALALAENYDGQANGRVRDVPDLRTIRYYTTLGLIDRPADMRGRTALYGMRHLLQLVAIKRLQTHGLSLAEIQTRLVGMTAGALQKLAQLPAGFDAGEDVKPQEASARDRFWNAAPVDASHADEDGTGPAADSEVWHLSGVPLAGGATLLLDSARPLDEHDLSALRVAAAPLVRLLKARRLLAADEGTPHTKGESS
jgi:DNA-binding transcriptional MerR regulator